MAVLFFISAASAFALAPNNQSGDPGQQFQAAVAQYNARHYAEAVAQLEAFPDAKTSFKAQELLGLAYAAESRQREALEHFQAAVQLNPTSAAARINLAASLAHEGQRIEAIAQLRQAVRLEPENFAANRNLAELYLQSQKLQEALPLLEEAQQIKPASYDNGYDLALTYFLTGKLADARRIAQNLLQVNNSGELHNLLGQIEEKDGKFVEAANEFATASQMDPSEDNLFAWGSELLLHRTYDPAIDVFRKAGERYPNSPRLLIGLGMALDLRGKYDEAVKALLAAADLNPSDPRCYLYLSKAYDSSPTQAEEVIQRFKRYAELEPSNALAKYYYAMSLWKGKRLEDATVNLESVQSLLQKSVVLNAALPEPHVQLGNLYADQHQYEKSIPEYTRALELNPNLPDAHYRLGQDYVHIGQKERAQQEFQVYQKLRAEHLAEVDKERAEVQQFVYSEKEASPTRQ